MATRTNRINKILFIFIDTEAIDTATRSLFSVNQQQKKKTKMFAKNVRMFAILLPFFIKCAEKRGRSPLWHFCIEKTTTERATFQLESLWAVGTSDQTTFLVWRKLHLGVMQMHLGVMQMQRIEFCDFESMRAFVHDEFMQYGCLYVVALNSLNWFKTWNEILYIRNKTKAWTNNIDMNELKIKHLAHQVIRFKGTGIALSSIHFIQ